MKPSCTAKPQAGQKLIVGNWKMNGLKDDAKARISAIVKDLGADTDVGYVAVLCPPATLLATARQHVEDVYLCGAAVISIGGQDCSPTASGAFTGDVSAEMLADAGCSYVILGHSERRQGHDETDALVALKAKAAHAAGLTTIICVGETEEQRAAGKHLDIVAAQVKASLPACATVENTVIAYEPIWAIGTGKTATAEDVREMHAHLRGIAGEGMRLLYGGSVKPSNAAEILSTENVDGVLVGGASLVAADFVAIARAS